jgi:hypothetical protein
VVVAGVVGVVFFDHGLRLCVWLVSACGCVCMYVYVCMCVKECMREMEMEE